MIRLAATAAAIAAVTLAAVIGSVLLLISPTSAGGFTPGADLGLDPEQTRNATIALRVADRLHAGELARVSMITAGLGESDLRVVANAAGSGYCGVFQADPDNIACDDTEQQAESFLKGGLGFQAGGAIALEREHPDWTPGTIATKVEASGQPGSWYDVNVRGGREKAERIVAAWEAGGGTLDPTAAVNVAATTTLTPKQLVDQVVLPVARSVGIDVTAASVEAANAQHSVLTTTGGVSDHKGPPSHAWAADMSDNWVSTVGSPNMTRLAQALAKMFAIPWTGAGLVTKPSVRVGACRFRLQLIYMTLAGGDHRNHVHLGARALGCS
jgi:hypothetical protein